MVLINFSGNAPLIRHSGTGKWQGKELDPLLLGIYRSACGEDTKARIRAVMSETAMVESSLPRLRGVLNLRRNAFTHFTLRHLEVVVNLQIHPELGTVAEIASQSKRRIGTDRTLPVEDRRDPPRRHTQREGEFVG